MSSANRLMALLIAAGLLTSGCAWLQQAARQDSVSSSTAVGTEPALRAELLTMAKADQDARKGGASPRMREADRRHTARMKEIVAQHGWPGWKLVGQEGEDAAWLLVQHADAEPGFQRECLRLLEAAVRRQDASPRHLAYLTDRVATNSGQPQVYGTQFYTNDLGEMVPQAIADEANVDARRQAVGLEPLAEYRAAMNQHTGPRKVVGDPAYREQILALCQAAQASPGTMQAQASRLKTLMQTRGWPTAPLVGQEVVDGALWLAVTGQLDLPFLRALVSAQEAAFAKGETQGQSVAYLVDQVLLREGKRQRYGTHFVWVGDRYVPSPIDDEAHVDQRRAALKMMPMAEWTALMRRMPPPRDPAAP